MIIGVLKTRPPGMRINLIPLYAWYVLVAASMILFAFPPLIAGSLLLEIERAFHWPFFAPAGGGDPDRRAALLLPGHASGGAAVHAVPMLFVFGTLAVFVPGLLTGVMVALVPFDFQAHVPSSWWPTCTTC